LLAGITAGILFNPMTGPQTRKWLMEKVTGDSSDDFSYSPSSPLNDPVTGVGTGAGVGSGMGNGAPAASTDS